MRNTSLTFPALSVLVALGTVGLFTVGPAGCEDSEGSGGSGGAGGNKDMGFDVPLLPDKAKDQPLNEAGNYCADPTGAGMIHDKDITATETWTTFDSPHIVKGTLKVGSDSGLATLNIDGCAVVRFEAGAGLEIAAAGKRGALYAAGIDNYHPITFTGTEQKPGHWKGIYFGTGDGKTDDSANSKFIGVNIEYAGGPAGRAADAALYLEGTGKPSGFNIKLDADGLNIQSSAKYGLYTTKGARLKGTGKSGNFMKNGGRPARVEADMVGDLPTGDYTMGNKDPGIEVQGTDGVCSCDTTEIGACAEGLCVRTSTNWGYRGAPYVVKGQIHVGATGMLPVILTVNPLTTFLMTAGSGFEVGVDTQLKGALRLQGDPSNPVVLKPDMMGAAAGHWVGVVYGPYSDWEGTGSRIQYVTIEGAGKATKRPTAMGACGSASIPPNQGAIIFNRFDPKNKFLPSFDPVKFQDIKNTKVCNCAGHAIVRAWDSDVDPPDFSTAAKMNDLTGETCDPMKKMKTVAGCKQTEPQKGGACSPCTP